ncbi:hypothetical protein CNR22_07835 [Sphingobacteriaceae bacterium]|nr:hypothetical protein CNR22_07835 [Sphingobacteriaceae bacterium]
MYFYPLNFIRFVLAVSVILFHYGVAYYPFNLPVLKTLIVNSSFRVSFFFFISGFVMCMVYARQVAGLTAKFFYRRRLTRIFPLYWLAFVWTLLVVIFIKDASPKGLNILLHAFGLQSLNPGHVLDLNYPTWSISVELIFYLVFPFLLKWMMSVKLEKLMIVTLITWFLQSLQHFLFVKYVYNATKISEEFISSFPLWHLSTFFFGMTAARFVAINKYERFISKYTLLMLLLGILIMAYIIFIPNPFLKYVHNGLLCPVFMLLIVALYYDKSVVHKILSYKHVSNFGNLSYGLFIFQYPVWVVSARIAGEPFVKSNWFFLIYFFVLLCVAKLINSIFEKPMLKWLRKE